MITAPDDVVRDSIATADCPQKNVRVFVYSTDDNVFKEVPTVDASAERDQVAVEVTITKDGPGAISRLSDVYVPAVWKQMNVWERLPFGESDEAVPVLIEARKYDEDDFKTLHYGWLRKIGSGGEGRLLRFRVDDYAKLLNSEYISQPFEANAFKFESTVVEGVRNTLESKGMTFGFENRTELTDEAGDTTEFAPTAEDTGLISESESGGYRAASKHFEADRDTLVDVMDWATGLVDDVYWYVEFDGSKPVIVLDTDISDQWLSEEAYPSRNERPLDDLNGPVTIRRNRALQDMNPINGYRVRGKSAVSLKGFLSGEGTAIISDKFPIARVRHADLYRRANFVAHEKDKEIEAVTIDGAIKKAKKLLRDEISGAGESSMVLNGNPDILPWDTIASRPVCGTYVEADVPVMRFGIEGVTHSIPATGLYTTEILTSITLTKDDIIVVDNDTHMAKGKGTEDSADTRLSGDEDILSANLP